MDASINQIDLEYLTNYSYEHHLPKQNDVYNADLSFYKRRIFKLTKDLLLGKKVNSTINACFKNYTQNLINHFKFIDKSDIIQEDYKNIQSHKKKNHMNTLDMTNANNIMFKKNNRTFDISDLLNIKNKSTTKKIIIPKERKLNLKHPKLKNKGLEKNINNLQKEEKSIIEIKEIIDFISLNEKRGICRYINA